MANKTKDSTPYEDFDPTFDLKQEKGLDTLIIHLPDFKKKDVKVKVSKKGVLKISGERPRNGDGTKRRRFLKEIQIPEGCDMNEIRAKFTTACLRVTMPKKIKVAQKLPRKKVVLGLGIAAVIMVGIGAFMAHKYGSPFYFEESGLF